MATPPCQSSFPNCRPFLKYFSRLDEEQQQKQQQRQGWQQILDNDNQEAQDDDDIPIQMEQIYIRPINSGITPPRNYPNPPPFPPPAIKDSSV